MILTEDEKDKNRSIKNALADSTSPKDWASSRANGKPPDYVGQTGVFLLIFIMGATIRGEWLLYLAFYWRWQDASPVPLPQNPLNSTNATDNALADFMEQRFQHFWPTLVAATAVGYLFYFGIGGYLQVKYYIGMKDRPEDWKCQPNHWLPPHLELHEIIVGAFSLTLGSVISTGLACWVINGGYTSIYYEWGQHGLLWELASWPIIFLGEDYITYWIHRIYHFPFLYKHFHKLHHTYKQPTAFSVTAIHPFEFVNIQLVYIAPMFIMPVHVVTFITILIYIYTHGIIDHSGINFKKFWWQPWQPDAIFHDNHHQYFHVNFGFNVELWDKIHGTARQKDKIYREDIFFGAGKDLSQATKAELEADLIERKDENPLAYQNNKYAFELTEQDLKKVM